MVVRAENEDGLAHFKAISKNEDVHTPKKTANNKQSGKLYVTPKRKTSSELQESLSPKRLKQKGIEAAVDSQVCYEIAGFINYNDFPKSTRTHEVLL